jgi:tetratricopeptide (TPR) repeat protein
MGISIEQALECHRAGKFSDAESIYRLILRAHPEDVDALHLLGMLCHSRGDSAQAESLIRKAISLHPKQPIFYSNLGVVLTAMGKHSDAIKAYEDAYAHAPLSAETLNNLGVAFYAIGCTPQAIDAFKQSLILKSDYIDARNNLMQLLKIYHNSAAAEHTIADLLHEAGRDIEAIVHYRNAIALDPDFIAAHNNLANLLTDAGQLTEAIPVYLRALSLQPDSPDLLSNLGNAMREARQPESAMQCYRRALELDPDHVKTHNNIGNALCESGDWQHAIDSYERALAIDPRFAETLNNLGTALEEMGERDRAFSLYQRALELSPHSISAPWNIALLQLLRGDYQNGWQGYEHRWRQKKQCRSARNFKQPLLSLSNARAKKVLLHAEQGFGDAIQFCRYAGMVDDLGATVIVECPVQLVQLFSTLRGVSAVVAKGETLPDFDLQCPLMSLPMVFGTTLETIPPIRYLSADSSWQMRFKTESQAIRIGLVWAGHPTHQKDVTRSLRLADFACLSQIPGLDFYSLQVGPAAVQASSPPPDMHLTDWTDDLRSFADTAALIQQLDLVITVDTAVAHLSGALGKSVWILIPFQPDWRWLLDRDDSPWYPTARLFRQRHPGRWDEPLDAIARALKKSATGFGLPGDI